MRYLGWVFAGNTHYQREDGERVRWDLETTSPDRQSIVRLTGTVSITTTQPWTDASVNSGGFSITIGILLLSEILITASRPSYQ